MRAWATENAERKVMINKRNTKTKKNPLFVDRGGGGKDLVVDSWSIEPRYKQIGFPSSIHCGCLFLPA